MIEWTVEPLWDTLARLQPSVPIVAADVLAPVVRESARLPRLAGHDFRGLDKLRSLMGQGVIGVIVR